MAEISSKAVGVAAGGAVLAIALAFATSSDSSDRPEPKAQQVVAPSDDSPAQRAKAD